MKPSRVLGMVMVVATVAASVAETGQAAPWSPSLTLARGDSAGQAALAASATDGSVVVAWQDGDRIFARRVTADGTRGPARRLGTGADLAAGPQIAVDPSGAAVVVWHGPRYSVHARRMDRRGKLGPLRRLAPGYAPGPYNTPEARVAVDAAGVATIVWPHVVTESIEPKGARIVTATVHARRLSPGDRLGPTVDLPTGDGANTSPRIAVDGSGRAIVAWVLETGSGYAIRATRIERNGSMVPAREIVGPQTYWPGVAPELAVSAAGEAVFAWIAMENDGNAVMMRRMGAGGELRQTLSLATGGLLYFPRVALDAYRRVTVVWRDATFSDLIRARQISSDDAVGPSLTLSVAASAETSGPDVAIDRTGSATTVWAETLHRQTAEGYAVTGVLMRARRIATDGRLEPIDKLASVDAAYGSGPRIVEGRGILTATWPTRQLRRAGQSQRSAIEIARRVSSCPTSQLERARFGTPANMSGPAPAPIRATLAFDQAVEVRIGRVALRYRTSTGTVKVVRLRVLRHVGGPVRHRLVLGAATRAAHRGLRLGHAARLRIRLRTRPYATGCPYGASGLVVAAETGRQAVVAPPSVP